MTLLDSVFGIYKGRGPLHARVRKAIPLEQTHSGPLVDSEQMQNFEKRIHRRPGVNSKQTRGPLWCWVRFGVRLGLVGTVTFQ